MANKRITELTDIGTPANNDVLEIVDVSDTTDSPEGTSKRVLVSALSGGSTTQVTSKVVYCTLADVGAESPFQEDIDTLVKDWVVAQEITKADNEVYDFVLVDEFNFNFDIEATDWANEGITDEASFIAYLEGLSAENIIVDNFSLIDGRLQCKLSFEEQTDFTLTGLGITKINKCLISGKDKINFNSNDLTNIEESVVFSTSLTQLDFGSNQFTEESYENAEAWATNQPAFINPCQIYFDGNPDSPIGTNLETILLTKNATLIY